MNKKHLREPFDFDDIQYLAVELPDEIKFYKYSSDFEGEVAAIDRMTEKPLPECLRKRLWLERMIAVGMSENYYDDEDALLSALQKDCPALTKAHFSEILDSGHVDYIRKNGKLYFEDSAASNIENELDEYIFKVNNPGEEFVRSLNTPRRAAAEKMIETGSSAYRFTVREHIRVRESALCGEPLLVHLPFPAECPSQSEIKFIASSHPCTISNAAHRTASFKIDDYKGEDIWLEFSYVNRQNYLKAIPVGAVKDKSLPSEYLSEQYPHIRFTPYLVSLAREIAGSETDSLAKARLVYDYVTSNIKYSYLRDYLYIDNITEFTALNKRGDCGAQALLFITLCRILGVPAKWESGKVTRPDRIGSHDWALFYTPEYGWRHADLSAGGGAFANKDEVLRNFFFGNVDPLRMVANTEFQSEFEPKKTFIRTDPYDNQTGEAEYKTHALFGEHLSRWSEMVSAEEIK